MAKTRTGVPRASEQLMESGIAYALHRRRSDTDEDESPDGVPCAIDEGSERLLGTMLVDVDGQPTLAVLPATARLDPAALASALGGNTAVPCDAQRAEQLTGYPIDRMSPLATKETLPIVIDVRALDFKTVYVSAGTPGTFLELRPDDLVNVCGARTAPLSADPT